MCDFRLCNLNVNKVACFLSSRQIETRIFIISKFLDQAGMWLISRDYFVWEVNVCMSGA